MDRNLASLTGIEDGIVVLDQNPSRLERDVKPMDRSQPSSAEISPTKRRSRSRKLIPTVEGDKVIAERFRTKLCRNYLLHPDHPCPYEERCMFAHGDHELRTAAQNMLDGLMSEEAIREFKRKETDSAKSASLSESVHISASTVPLISRSVDPQDFPIVPRPVEDGLALPPLQLLQNDTENANFSSHNDDVIAVRTEKPPFAARPLSDSTTSSSATSSEFARGNHVPAFAFPLYGGCGSRFPQEWLNVPGRIFHEERDTANGNSVSILTYTHDPYSWRAV
jgi:hypothetical protein